MNFFFKNTFSSFVEIELFFKLKISFLKIIKIIEFNIFTCKFSFSSSKSNNLFRNLVFIFNLKNEK